MTEHTIVVGLASGDRVLVEAARVTREYDGTIVLSNDAGVEVAEFPTGEWAVREQELVE